MLACSAVLHACENHCDFELSTCCDEKGHMHACSIEDAAVKKEQAYDEATTYKTVDRCIQAKGMQYVCCTRESQ